MEAGTVIGAQISGYPLRQEHLSPAVQAVKAELEAHRLKPEIGTMSTQVVGEADAVFAALRDAFVRVAANGQVVMTVAGHLDLGIRNLLLLGCIGIDVLRHLE